MGRVVCDLHAQRRRPIHLPRPPFSPTRRCSAPQQLTLFRQIVLDGEPIGTIYLESDLTELRARLLAFLTILAVIMVAAAIVSLLLSSWLQRLISRPILELGDVARRVSSSKDYTLRATSRSDRRDRAA